MIANHKTRSSTLGFPQAGDLWSRRYQPDGLHDLPLFRQEQVRRFLASFDNVCAGRNRTHILVIVGSVGSGKTSLLRAVCRERGVEFCLFEPDEDLFDDENNRKRPALLMAVEGFLQRNGAKPKRALVFDDLSLEPDDFRTLARILDAYDDLASVFLLYDDDFGWARRNGPLRAQYFHVPPASPSLLRRILGRIGQREGVGHLVASVVAAALGDIRAAINALQWAACAGCEVHLNYFQAIGEVLYQKRVRSADEILAASQLSPSSMVTGVWENCLDFLEDVDGAEAVTEAASFAHTLMYWGWNAEVVREVAATTLMRTVVCQAAAPPRRAFAFREGYKSRLRQRPVLPRSEWRCWPGQCGSAAEMDQVLFRAGGDESGVDVDRVRRLVEIDAWRGELARAEGEFLAWDPVES